MHPSSTSSSAPGINRREAIRRAAVLAGVAFSPSWLSLVDRGAAAAQGPALSAGQLADVSAAAERILPRTDTPGAIDAGVPAFISALYSGFMSDADRQTLTSGLSRLDAASRAAHGTTFAALTVAQQNAVLRGIAVAEEGQPQGFFRLFRSATILGYFTSEQVGRNVLHYDPIPGRYDGCVPLSEVGNRNWTT
jgi:gluconate 2-dehydrogenase gamma chain